MAWITATSRYPTRPSASVPTVHSGHGGMIAVLDPATNA